MRAGLAEAVNGFALAGAWLRYPHHRPVDKTVSSLGSGRIFPKITSGTTGPLLHFSDVPCSMVPFPGITGDFYSIGSLKPGAMVMLPFRPAYLLQHTSYDFGLFL